MLLVILACLGLIDFFTRDYDARFGEKLIDPRTRATKALQTNEFQLAQKEFSLALRQYPADPTARVGLGRTYHSLNRLEEAEKQYEMAIERANEILTQAYQGLGQLSEKAGRKEDAEKYFRASNAVGQRHR